METRSGSLISQSRAGSALFTSFAAQDSQTGRRDTQQSSRQSISRHGSVRHQSGRIGSISSSRYSRGSVMRGGKGGGGAAGMDSSGLPSERILCIDEEGRDRTPKPLLTQRRGDSTAPGWGAGGGFAAGGESSSAGDQVPGGGFGFNIPTARSLMGSEATEVSLDGAGLPPGVRQGPRESLLHGVGGRESVLHGVGRESSQFGSGGISSIRGSLLPGGEAQEAAARLAGDALLDGGTASEVAQQPAMPALLALQNGPQLHYRQGQQPPPQQQQQHSSQAGVKSKATQCAPVNRASRGVQVLPWELHGCAAKCGNGDGGEEDAAALATRQGQAGEGEDGMEGGEGAEDEEAALLALHSFGPGGGGGIDTRRNSRAPSHRGGGGAALRSQNSSRRESMAGLRRESTASGIDEWSRPGTSVAGSRRTSNQASEWSARDSMMSSRASFAAFMAADGRASMMTDGRGSMMTDGRGSVMSSAAGFYAGVGGNRPQTGRGSVMAAGQAQGRGGERQTPSQPQQTPEQAAAAAAAKEKAQQERALARLPGLLRRLQAAERAVLVNVQHAKLAQYHNVQLCHVAPSCSTTTTARPASSTPQALPLPEGAAGSPSLPPPDEDANLEQLPAGREGGGQTSTAVSPRPGGRQEEGAGEGPGAATAPPGSLSGRHHSEEMELLWSWRSGVTAGLPVSCLAWCKASPGLLAVGYGRLQYEVTGTGMLAVWSLANPTHPVWHAATPCGVSALDWSGKAPGTLAVGFYDGSVAIYDISSAAGASGKNSSGNGSKEPLVRAPPAGGGNGASGGHAEPVWRLRYVPQATDHGEEMLVSISSDGRVLEWKHAQGLERVQLLRLKRPQRSNGSGSDRRSRCSSSGGPELPPLQQAPSGSSGTSGMLAGAGSGTCFDFSTADPRTYLVGTEEGAVHRCSTVFSEQYVQSYSGHLAPVYQVCYSPFSPDHFLTASADWSVRLWSEGQARSLWTFQLPTCKAEVADVAFCPAAATLFAAAAGSSLQVWDVEHSVLMPRGIANRLDARLTSLAFSQEAPVVVVGADDGVVSAYSLAGMYEVAACLQPEQQRQRLEAALLHHTARHVAG